MNEQHSQPLTTIAIDQLSLGMYVVAIVDTDNLEIKSEGYITQSETIKQLIKARIKQVIIDPKRTKKAEQIDRVFSDIKTIQKGEKDQKKTSSTKQTIKESNERKVSIEQELKKANSLYKGAKALQATILDNVKLGKALHIDEVQNTTDALVESIFRNPDALTCLTRIKSKDSFLLEHSLNVSILMSTFAKHLGFDKRLIHEITLGAFLHDIGKVLIPSDILHKRGALTPQETKIMRSHVALGLKMLEDSPDISHIAMRMIREHHERNDGSGYPQGLSEKEVSKYGKMIAIVDSYDAMTCERPYKKSVHPISAFKTLVAESPGQYDEELVEKFIQCLGVYPVGTLVKLNSGKLGLISQLNKQRPLHPHVKVFYNTRLSQAIPIEEINLAKSKYKDQIDCCIKPEEFNLNLLGFFKNAFID